MPNIVCPELSHLPPAVSYPDFKGAGTWEGARPQAPPLFSLEHDAGEEHANRTRQATGEGRYGDTIPFTSSQGNRKGTTDEEATMARPAER